jgi:predicted house-cleaning noncanonical NTP pyrophosphatase (MazG superfamily)
MRYNKLVRDKIPQIIEQSGDTYKIHRVEGNEFRLYLRKKLEEEVSEYLEDENIEELADVLEVIHGLVRSHDIRMEDLEEVSGISMKKEVVFRSESF